MDYAVIWQYFGWANQLLAAATLWAVSIYLRSKNRCCWTAATPRRLPEPGGAPVPVLQPGNVRVQL